jgi:phenylacetate-CoA ligase
MRAEIEERTGLDAVDIYGLSEVIGPGVAQECVETKDGLHIWEDHFYPEVIDSTSGAAAAEGERGELVFTSLTKQAMPLIRYRTRDLTRLLPGTARPAFRRMKGDRGGGRGITGRSDDMIILRGVNLFPTQIEEIVLRTPGLSPHFQLLLTRANRLDHLTVLAEAKTDINPELRAASAARVVRAIKEGIGVTVEVRVLDPGSLERSTGKLRRVLDQRRDPARP